MTTVQLVFDNDNDAKDFCKAIKKYKKLEFLDTLKESEIHFVPNQPFLISIRESKPLSLPQRIRL